jgi:hypothetical protein
MRTHLLQPSFSLRFSTPRCRQSVRRSCLNLKRLRGRAVVTSFNGGNTTSNAGALLFGQVDRGLCLMRWFAGSPASKDNSAGPSMTWRPIANRDDGPADRGHVADGSPPGQGLSFAQQLMPHCQVVPRPAGAHTEPPWPAPFNAAPLRAVFGFREAFDRLGAGDHSKRSRFPGVRRIFSSPINAKGDHPWKHCLTS